MRATEELRADHGLLRAKLAILERLLPLAPTTKPTLLEQLARIARMLRCHTEKEELLVSLLRERLSAELADALPDLLDAHERHSRLIRSGLRLLAARSEAPTAEPIEALTRLITELREHLARDEDRLFPELDQLLTDAQAAEAARLMREVGRAEHAAEPEALRLRRTAVSSDVTVGQILRRHSQLAPVLAAFGVEEAADEARTLDELRVTRGLDADSLLLALQQSLDEPGELMVPAVFWDSCDGMVVINHERRILAMNPAMEQLAGRRIHELAGRQMCGALLECQDAHGCSMVSHPESCPGLRALRRLRPVRAAEYTVTTGRGHRVPVCASYTPIRPAPGLAPWAIVVVRRNALQQRREREMRQHAMTDPLTGLPDRAGVLHSLAKELERAQRHDRPLALLLADIDGFRRYNTAFGHPAGDELLKRVGRLVRVACRSMEWAGRIGPDTFALIVPDASVLGAHVVARRMQRLVGKRPTSESAHDGPTDREASPVTLSIGVAVFPKDGDRTEGLMAAAERRLREARQLGVGHIAASPFAGDRRPEPRFTLDVPILVDGQEGRLLSVSCSGAYCLMARGSLSADQVVAFAASLPAQRPRGLPDRLAGHARITRIDSYPGTGKGDAFGIALEFDDDVISAESITPEPAGR